VGRRAGHAARDEPAGGVQAPARAARGRAGPRAPGRAAPAVRVAPRAATRSGRLAAAIPAVVGRPARRAGTAPRHDARHDRKDRRTVNGTLWTEQGRQVLRFERRLAHPVEKVWRAITEPAE